MEQQIHHQNKVTIYFENRPYNTTIHTERVRGRFETYANRIERFENIHEAIAAYTEHAETQGYIVGDFQLTKTGDKTWQAEALVTKMMDTPR